MQKPEYVLEIKTIFCGIWGYKLTNQYCPDDQTKNQ